jgi:peptidoglycan hydrolase-like protein with peptidoglycan-binding domain
MRGDDVMYLQQILNKDVDTQIASTGLGSPGNESAYFGPLTEKAVQRFQVKHGIVSSGTPQTSGFGAVGPKTLLKLQEVSLR